MPKQRKDYKAVHNLGRALTSHSFGSSLPQRGGQAVQTTLRVRESLLKDMQTARQSSMPKRYAAMLFMGLRSYAQYSDFSQARSFFLLRQDLLGLNGNAKCGAGMTAEHNMHVTA